MINGRARRDETIANRNFRRALREWLGLDPLDGDGEREDEPSRFARMTPSYVMPRQGGPCLDGMTSKHRAR